MSKRDYEAEIIQALKEKPRDGITLQRNLGMPPNEMCGVLKDMEDKGLIHWDDTELVWKVVEE